MKIKNLVIATSLIFSVSTFAQKDELKTLKKIYAKDVISGSDLTDYKGNVIKLSEVATEEGDKIYADFYKSMVPILELNALGPKATPMEVARFVSAKTISDLASALNATLEYEKKSGKKVYTDDIKETITSFKPMFWQYALALDGQKEYKKLSEVLYSIYQLDKKDQEKLYLAASYAISGQEHDKALQYFNELNAANYTGEGTLYYAKSKANDKEDLFNSQPERDAAVKLGTHLEPRDEKVPSKRGEIYKSMTYILIQKGDLAGAKKTIKDARNLNPEDVSLLMAEADLYFKTNDLDMYKKLISEAVVKTPNDADLFYNLGVISGQSKDPKERAAAEKYYLRAIEINPKYKNAYMNLSALRLEGDTAIVEEMNKLGTTPADNKKYDVLKAKRLDLFRSVLPYLEKAEELFVGDKDVKATLLNVYNALDMTEKYKALKAKN